MTTYTCDHCGRVCGDYAGGHGSVTKDGTTYNLCHPNEPERPDCYHLVTVYHHRIGSLKDNSPTTVAREDELLRAVLSEIADNEDDR